MAGVVANEAARIAAVVKYVTVMCPLTNLSD